MNEATTQVRKLSKQARKSGQGLDSGALAGLLVALKGQVSDAGNRVQKDVRPACRDAGRRSVARGPQAGPPGR